ncbi:MAG: pilus assembly protein N-terminal domain-containing protein [Pirellulaceae bacterium]
MPPQPRMSRSLRTRRAAARKRKWFKTLLASCVVGFTLNQALPAGDKTSPAEGGGLITNVLRGPSVTPPRALITPLRAVPLGTIARPLEAESDPESQVAPAGNLAPIVNLAPGASIAPARPRRETNLAPIVPLNSVSPKQSATPPVTPAEPQDNFAPIVSRALLTPPDIQADGLAPTDRQAAAKSALTTAREEPSILPVPMPATDEPAQLEPPATLDLGNWTPGTSHRPAAAPAPSPTAQQEKEPELLPEAKASEPVPPSEADQTNPPDASEQSPAPIKPAAPRQETLARYAGQPAPIAEFISNASPARSQLPGVLVVPHRQTMPLRLKSRVTRMEIQNPEICETLQYASTEVSLIGKRKGETRLAVWTADSSEPQLWSVRVDGDPQSASRQQDDAALNRLIRELYPRSRITLASAGQEVVVQGVATDRQQALEILSLIRSVRLVPVVDRVQVLGR